MATLEFQPQGVKKSKIYHRTIDARVRILHGGAEQTGEARLAPVAQIIALLPFEAGNAMAKWALALFGKERYAKVNLTLTDREKAEIHVWQFKKAYVHWLEEIEQPEVSQNATAQENAMRAVIRGLVADGQDYDSAGILTLLRLPQVQAAALVAELAAQGVKHKPQNIAAIGRQESGKIAFIETGEQSAGLIHILTEHEREFAQVGIMPDAIPGYVLKAVTQGKVVGYQGPGTGRPIVEFMHDGAVRRMAVTIGSNGYIVGANLKSGRT